MHNQTPSQLLKTIGNVEVKLPFLFNQSSFSEWVSGGENSVALSFHVDYDWSFEKNGWKWDTKFLGDFVLTKISGTKYLR